MAEEDPCAGLSSYVAEQIKDDAPEWNCMSLRLHDWRTHIGENVQKLWKDIPLNIRVAIALDAQATADSEHWD